MTREQYRAKRLNEKVLRFSNELTATLEQLSTVASRIMGEELDANICNGAEIEFRSPDNAFSNLYSIEDILSKK